MYSLRKHSWNRRSFMYKVTIAAVILYVWMVVFAGKAHAEEPSLGEGQTDTEIYQMLHQGQMTPKTNSYTTPQLPTVYLTFDDGPSTFTPQVLDILRDEGILATFFVLGSQAEARPEVLRRIVAEGHSLGNHTYNHKYDELYKDFSFFWDQVEQTDEWIERITGVRTNLVRAPGGTYGKFDAFYYYYLDQAGYRVYDWNMDSGDSKRVGVPASEIMETVKKGPFHHELILLLHDGSGHEQTLEALPEIIRFLRDKDYQFAPITDDVKPVQFRIDLSKAKRAVSSERFSSMLSEVRSSPAVHSMSIVHQGQQSVRESAAALPLARAIAMEAVEKRWSEQGVARDDWRFLATRIMGTKLAALGVLDLPREAIAALGDVGPLPLNSSARKLSFATNDYTINKGRLFVPVRTLMQQMGGQVEWEESTETASIMLDTIRIDFHSGTNRMTVYNGIGEGRIQYVGDMRLEGGVLYVPIRETFKLLRVPIRGYTASLQGSEVIVDVV